MILDWVPAHFPRDDWALARFDGTALYEHDDPRRGAHPDWGTLVFNFGRNEVRNFLLSPTRCSGPREYHADGIRVDAVASMLYLDYSRKAGEWVPNEFGGREDLDAVAFLKELNEVLHAREPGVVSAAEESTAWPGVSRPTYLGGLGFGFKWNMGWMHDTLGYFQQDPIYRRYHHHELTFSLMYAFSENFILPLSPRRGRARQGLAARRRCRATAGSSSRTCARCTPTCGRTPARSCCSWAASSRQEQEWSHERSLDWHLLERRRATPACSRSCATSTASTATSPRCGRSTSTRPASTGSSPTTPTRNVVAFAPRSATTATDASSCVGEPVAGAARRATASACRARAAGARRSTPTSSYYGGSDVGNLGGVEAEADRRGTSQPCSAEVDAAAARRRLARAGSE